MVGSDQNTTRRGADVFPSETYRGPNCCHSKFRDGFGYLNALYYLVVSCRGQLQARLQEDIQKPGVAVGVVTNAISTAQFQGVFVHKEDARHMAGDFDGFLLTFQHQTIVSAYRVFVTYAAEFILELQAANLIVLSEDEIRRLCEGFLSSKEIGKLYTNIGIPITITDEEEVGLKTLVATRNVIEHNDCLVNKEYLRLTGASGLIIGDSAPAGSKEAGEALAIAGCLADSINKRGVLRWPSLAA